MIIPTITAKQMQRIDQLMAKDLGISTLELMTLAGFNVAEWVRRFLAKKKRPQIIVLCGKGGNGGDGMAAARHLINSGMKTTIFLASNPAELKGDPFHQYWILEKMKVKVRPAKEANLTLFKKADLIIDALLGYNLKGEPEELFTRLIQMANQSGTFILAVDVPSGLDATTGNPFKNCIKAGATLTLGLPKTGLLKKKSRSFLGELWLADIGIPPKLYQKVGIKIGPIFKKGGIQKNRG